MDLNNIKAFIAVADTQSFSQAAEHLHVTQPAVSKRIAALENSLSTKLFDRIARHVILTEAGKTILPKCRLILDTVNDATTIIHNLTGEVTGCLDIGTSHHIGLHHMPPILRQYAQEYPNVELNIHFLSSEHVCEKVTTGHLEMGIITLPPCISEQLTTQALWHDQMQFVVNTQHTLSKKNNYSLSQLMAFNAILPECGTYTYSIIADEFEKKGLELQSTFATHYLESIKMLVSVGLGWSVLPETLIDKDLHIVKVPNVSLSRTLGIVRHKQRTLSNAATAMTVLLNKAATINE